ncbi:uncharacterized protein [Penaeus vannamei]|uniref:uncharacterized protein isoform X2 n=1 Tax=Penaeus vannamei TaxID=6689 RepID=UPI00387F8E94
MPKSCIAVGCSNHNLMNRKGLSFHRFPDREKNTQKWRLWVEAMRRVNEDGSPWAPGGKYAYICSEHFLEGKPSPDPTHPDFIPSVFKHYPLDKNKADKMKRYLAKEVPSSQKKMKISSEEFEHLSPAVQPKVEAFVPGFDVPNSPADDTTEEGLALEVKLLRREKTALMDKICWLEQQGMHAALGEESNTEAPTVGTERGDCTLKNRQPVRDRAEVVSSPISPRHRSYNTQAAFTPSRLRAEEDQAQGKYSHLTEHSKHQTLILKGLQEDATFADVTLTAEGQSLKAHKAVLSVMSPYFRGVLQNNPSPHPIIIMPLDMRFEDLKGIIDYIYMGEITVPSENLSSLFFAAKVLQITGLSPAGTKGVRARDALLSFSSAHSTHKYTGDTPIPTRTNLHDGVRIRTSRNEDIDEQQSSDTFQKNTGSFATQNLSQQEHLRQRASSSLPVVEAVDPLDISDQEKPEDWVSVDQADIIDQEEPQDLASFEQTVICDHKKKEDSASVEQTEYEADHPMSSFSGTISSGKDDAYLENDSDELDNSRLHHQGLHYHQSPSTHEVKYEAMDIKEEPID